MPSCCHAGGHGQRHARQLPISDVPAGSMLEGALAWALLGSGHSWRVLVAVSAIPMVTPAAAPPQPWYLTCPL